MVTHVPGTTLNLTKCCAMLEIDNLSHSKEPKEALTKLKDSLLNGVKYDWRMIKNAPLVIFTTVVSRTMADHSSRRTDDYGQDFTNYLMEHKLGNVTASEPVTNPSTNNKVVLWTWYPDYDELTKYYKLMDEIEKEPVIAMEGIKL